MPFVCLPSPPLPPFILKGGAAAAVPVAAKCGVLRSRAGKSADTASYFVHSDQTKADVAEGDNVVGVVIGKPGENYSVQIGLNRNASLPFLAFEGENKTRVLYANPHVHTPHTQARMVVVLDLTLAHNN